MKCAKCGEKIEGRGCPWLCCTSDRAWGVSLFLLIMIVLMYIVILYNEPSLHSCMIKIHDYGYICERFI